MSIFKPNGFILSTWLKIKKSNVGYRMAKGAFWSFTGTFFAKVVVLLSGIICARILSRNEYGELGIIRSTINMFVVFGSVGLGLTATKYIAEYKEKNKQKVVSIYYLSNFLVFITGSLVTLFILLFSPFIAYKSLNAPHLIPEIKIGGLLLFVTVINSAQNGTLVGFEDFKSIAINTFIGNFTEALLMNIGAKLYRVAGAIFGFGLGYILLLILNYCSIKKNFIKYNIQHGLKYIDYSDLHIFYKFSLPAALSGIMVMPVLWIVKAMLVNNSGFSEAGIFEAADQWRIMILFIPGTISNIILPILSSMQTDENNNKYIKILKYNLFINGGVALLLALIVSLFSKIIIGFYGPQFVDVLPLIILAISTIFISIANVVGISIASRSKMWFGFIFNLFWAIMLILFTYVFLQKGLGATGLALAFLCSYVIHAFLQLIYLFYNLRRNS